MNFLQDLRGDFEIGTLETIVSKKVCASSTVIAEISTSVRSATRTAALSGLNRVP